MDATPQYAVFDLAALLASMVVSYMLWIISTIITKATQDRNKPPKSTLGDIQIATQAEGVPFGVVFGTPARSSHVHVLWYGDLKVIADTYREQTVCYHHFLTVHFGLCRSLDAVQQLWVKDTAIWPVLFGESSLAADGTTQATFLSQVYFGLWGGWRRAGGIAADVQIEYGASDQAVNATIKTAMGYVTGRLTAVNIGAFSFSADVFATYPDGAFVGGWFQILTRRVSIVTHVGDTITVNGWPWGWSVANGVGMGFTACVPAAGVPNIPAFRGIVGLVWPGYWGISPNLPPVSWVGKRTQTLDDGTAQWYLAKADIGGDLNPAHLLRECLLDQTWGERMTADQLGTSWTTVADTLYTEGCCLSFFYVPEPGNLQDFVDLVLSHIDGFLWRDRDTGLLEIGLRRADYVLGDLEEFDLSDFEILRWHTPTWKDVPGRVIVRYSNRPWPQNAKTTTPYDDLAVQQKQGGRINEMIVDRPGIFSDTLAAKEVNRLGRALCRILSGGTLRSKRTMSHLHRGSVFKFTTDDPDFTITQMVVRVEKIKYGALGEDWVEVDVIQDVWADPDYTVYGTPDTPAWQIPPTDVDEETLLTGELNGHGSVSGITGVGNSGALTGVGTVGGTCTVPTSFSASPSSSISQSPSSSASA